MLEMDTLNAADQPAVSVSVFASKYAKTVEALLDYADTDRFIDDLRTAWERPIQSKEANVLLSPAVFDAGRSDETARGLANVEQVRGVWLDNDGGDLPHQEFAALFPRLRMVAMNTYSTAPGNERYRVFIPTTGGDAGHGSRRDHEDDRADPEPRRILLGQADRAGQGAGWHEAARLRLVEVRLQQPVLRSLPGRGPRGLVLRRVP